MNDLRDPNKLIALVLSLVIAGVCLWITFAGVR